MIIATLLVFIIVALKDRITIQRYYNTFQITPSIKLFYEWGYYVALDLAWLKWCVSITLYIKEYNATLEDGSETEPLWGGNNDNPDTNTTTGENTNATDKITTITDETTS
jgi:hypothetical protein